jgi:hypothetical protein
MWQTRVRKGRQRQVLETWGRFEEFFCILRRVLCLPGTPKEACQQSLRCGFQVAGPTSQGAQGWQLWDGDPGRTCIRWNQGPEREEDVKGRELGHKQGGSSVLDNREGPCSPPEHCCTHTVGILQILGLVQAWQL